MLCHLPASSSVPRRVPVCALAFYALAWVLPAPAAAQATAAPPAPRSDLDAFMERVLSRRDDNWRKLQQYVLDERERVEVLAPGRVRLFGLDRDYTWFIRDGVFVRSPLRANGVTVSEADRRAAEQRWIERERRRESRKASVTVSNEGVTWQGPVPEPTDAPADVGDVLRQEPQFVSAAYFLRFRFEPGRYALVGRESLDGREVLHIEYYPAALFRDDEARHETEQKTGGSTPKPDTDEQRRERHVEERLARQMNKVSLVSLWVEPTAHQILKYTFDNVGFDFLPGRWLVRVDDTRATMQMREAFPGVWLPAGIEAHVALTFAKGTYDAHYRVAYEDYRLADIKVQVR